MSGAEYPLHAFPPHYWIWVVYVCIASVCASLYLLIVWIEGNWRARLRVLLSMIMLFVVTTLVAFEPLVMLSGEPQIVAWRNKYRP